MLDVRSPAPAVQRADGRLEPAPWLAPALLAASIAVMLWSRLVGALPGERLLTDALFGRATRELVWQTTNFFVGFGAVLVVGLTVLCAGAIVALHVGRREAVLVVLAVAAGGLARIGKAILGETELWAELRPDDPAASMPSGHTAYAAAMFGLLAVLALEHGRREVAAMCAIVVAGVGASLVVAANHLPSDVLAGGLLGAAWTAALLRYGR